jgi:hypothetical protein
MLELFRFSAAVPIGHDRPSAIAAGRDIPTVAVARTALFVSERDRLLFAVRADDLE